MIQKFKKLSLLSLIMCMTVGIFSFYQEPTQIEAVSEAQHYELWKNNSYFNLYNSPYASFLFNWPDGGGDITTPTLGWKADTVVDLKGNSYAQSSGIVFQMPGTEIFVVDGQYEYCFDYTTASSGNRIYIGNIADLGLSRERQHLLVNVANIAKEISKNNFEYIRTHAEQFLTGGADAILQRWVGFSRARMIQLLQGTNAEDLIFKRALVQLYIWKKVNNLNINGHWQIPATSGGVTCVGKEGGCADLVGSGDMYGIGDVFNFGLFDTIEVGYDYEKEYSLCAGDTINLTGDDAKYAWNVYKANGNSFGIQGVTMDYLNGNAAIRAADNAPTASGGWKSSIYSDSYITSNGAPYITGHDHDNINNGHGNGQLLIRAESLIRLKVRVNVDSCKITYAFRKLDEHNRELKSSEIKFTLKNNSTNTIVDTFTAAETDRVWQLDKNTSYTITETEAPSEWQLMSPITFTTSDDVNNPAKNLGPEGSIWIWNSDSSIPIIKAVNRRKPSSDKITFTKIDTSTGNPLSGVRIKLDVQSPLGYSFTDTFTTGTSSKEYTSETVENFYDVFGEGSKITYTEISPKNSTYVHVTSPQYYTIKRSDMGKTVLLSLENYQIKLKKVDSKGNYVRNSTLTIYKADSNERPTGSAVDTLSTNGTDQLIKNLVEGQKYVVVETNTPDGYVKADNLIFIANKATSNNVLVMTDYRIQLKKVDDSGKLLAGAKFEVYDGSTKVSEAVTKSDSVIYLNGLEKGKTYTLKEIKTPSGYVKAKDVKFTATNDKTIIITDIQVKFNKQQYVGANKNLSGARFECREKSTNTLVDSWTQPEGDYIIKNLEEGKTYIIKEVEAPEGWVKGKDIEFTIDTYNDLTQ